MSRNYKIYNQELAHFVSFSVIRWIDVFVRQDYCNIIIESLKFCQREKGLVIYAWCIMSSHLHLIIGSKSSKQEDILRDFKRHTAIELIKAIGKNPQESRKDWLLWMFQKSAESNSNNTKNQFWQQNNHPIEISRQSLMIQKLNYIHNNPVKAGIVSKPEYYNNSSAIDYSDGKGLIEIERVHL